MRKNILLLIFLSLGLSIFAQTQEEQTPRLPQILPVSPEAASLGKYGDIPVNLSTGKINYTIPIYTIKVGSFELPLTLSYSYGGFMPEEEPTMIGMGWTANFGGAIIRQLKGKADEKSNLGYLGLSNYYENFFNLSQENRDLTIRNSGKGLWDSHPDSYIINTPLIDGTFRFKNDTTAIFTPYRNHKVSVLAYNTPGFNGFDITDDKGIIYTFNVPEITEQENLYGDADILNYKSSWMISKIALPDSSDEIIFSYEDYYHKISSLSKYRTRKVSLGSGPSCGQCENSSIFLSENETRINAKALSRIDFPNGYIVLDQNIIQNTPGVGNSEKIILRGLSIYNIYDQLIEKFTFNYFELEDYHFLTSIIKEGKNGDQMNYYSFDYYNLDQVPNTKIINDQTDIWGFYNGVTFDPDNSASQNADFSMSLIGALKKITYPTRGYTEIEYEPNSVMRSEDYYDSCNPVYDTIEEISIDSGDYPPAYCPSVGSPIEKMITIPFEQVIEVRVIAATADAAGEAYAAFSRHVEDLESTDPNYYCANYEKFPPENTPGMEINAIVLAEDGGDGTPVEQIQNEDFKKVNVKPGTYKLYVEVCGHGGQSTTANVKVKYREEPYQGVDENIEVGGIRVAKTTDYSSEGTTNIVKNYNYVQEQDSTLSSGILLANPKFSSSLILKQYDVGASQCLEQTEYFSSVIPLATYSGSHVLYKRVEIINEPDSNGKTVNYYTGIADDDPPPYFPTLTSINRGIQRGKLEKQEVFEKTNFGFALKQKTEHLYMDFRADNNDQNVFDFFSAKYVHNFTDTFGCNPVISDTGSQEYAFDYRTYYPDDYRIGSTIKTSYLNGDNIIQTTDYSYDTVFGLIKEVSSTDSNDNLLKTNYYYPEDVIDTTSLGIPNLNNEEYNAINRLKKGDLHKIGILVLTKTIKDQEASSQRTVYRDYGNNIILPGTIATSKNGEALEDRITYTDYDGIGNPLGIVKADGTPISYIWGYGQTLPVARLEKIAYADIDPANIANLQNLSDNDTDAASEEALRNALDSLRISYPGAVITGYTYDPLIGVTSISDSRGYTSFYYYDDFNRLANIKDEIGNIIEAFDYNYSQEIPLGYDPLSADISYGSATNDHQWFLADVIGGSGDYSYAWFEGIDASSTDFEVNTSGTNDTYQLIVACDTVKYIKLVVTDNVTGEVTQQTKVNNNACSYAPLTGDIAYGTHTNTWQNFSALVSGGSGDFSYAWFEGIGDSSTDFEGTPSGNGNTYQLMVDCGNTQYVKLVITDTVTGEIVEVVKVNDNTTCDYPPLNAYITYGPSNDTSQWFYSSVGGGSGNYTLAWYKGIGSSSTNFENTPSSTASSYQVSAPCSLLRYVKLVVTDTVTGLTDTKIKASNNSPCTGNTNEQ